MVNDPPSLEDLLRVMDGKAQAVSLYFAARQEASDTLTPADFRYGYLQFENMCREISATAKLIRDNLSSEILNTHIDRREAIQLVLINKTTH